jgi:hypothetical protein
MTKLKVVYQCCDLPGSQRLSINQLSRLINSDLFNELEIFLSLNGNLVNFLELAQFVEPYKNVRICHTSDRNNLMEYPALMLLKELADVADAEEYFLYFHLKGITHHGNQGIVDWRKYMEYWCIDRWKDCVAKLDHGHDTCGTNYISGPFLGVDGTIKHWNHYSGNFWWAKASYIKKLKKLPHPDSYAPGTTSELTGYPIDHRNMYRFDHEAWVASGNPNWYEIHKSPGGDHDNKGSYPGWHYRNIYPESMYKNEI